MRLKSKLIVFFLLFFLSIGFISAQGPGVKLLGTNGVYYLKLMWNEAGAANRVLNFLVSGSNRSLTIEADSLINQDLTTDAMAVQFASLGIGTATVPHGGVGAAMFAIDGANASAATGPHIQFTTASDDYPLMQFRNWIHDNISIVFDGYYDGAWKSSDAGSNFMISKSADVFTFLYDSGIAQGAVITWNNGIILGADGKVTLNAGTGINEYSTDGTMGGASDDAVPTEAAVKTYVDAQVTAQDLDFSGDAGTGAIDLDSQTFALSGTANRVSTSAAGQTITFTTPQDTHTGSSPVFVTVKLSSLTDGYIPYHVADATGLADSVIFQSGTEISIGGTSTTEKLTVIGNITIQDSLTDDTVKSSKLFSSQYDSGAEPEGFSGIGLYSTISTNEILIGGGSAAVNAATSIGFYTAANVSTRTGTSRMVIDSTGVASTGSFTSSAGDFIANDSIADADAGRLTFRKDRAGAIVQNNDYLGIIEFYGWDGDSFEHAAMITSYVDGTPGEGTDMPGALIFWTTPNASATPVARLTISEAGILISTETYAHDMDGETYRNLLINNNGELGYDSSPVPAPMPSEMMMYIEDLEARITYLESMILSKEK